MLPPGTFQSIIQSKIVTSSKARHLLAGWRLPGNKIVFTNGCFDLLHPGHLHLLHEARTYGDKLVVGLNTDASISRFKPGRPLQDEHTRALHLASLEVTDLVVLFDEDTPLQLIKELRPEVLVKGGDYAPDQVVGYEEVTATGGSVQIIPLLNEYSTTGLIRKIRQ